MCFALACSCNKKANDPVALTTPVVTIGTDGKATWDEVEHASGYAYKVSNGEQKTATERSVQLSDGQSITVKAVGDGKNYTDSAWSASKTYTANQNSDNQVELSTHAQFMDAGEGVKVKVQGVITGLSNRRIYFQDSDGGYLVATNQDLNLESNVVVGAKVTITGTKAIYNSSADWKGLHQLSSVDEIEVVETATVTPKDITSVVSAAAKVSDDELYALQNMLVTVKGATLAKDGSNYFFELGSVKPQIYFGGTSQVLDSAAQDAVKAVLDANDGKEADITGYVTLYHGNFQLLPAQNAVEVKGPAKLGKPVVSVDRNTGIASWAANTDAEGYIYQIKANAEGAWSEDKDDAVLDNGVYSIPTPLTEGQVIRVKAVGDDKNFESSEWSDEKTYTKAPMTHAQYMAAAKGEEVFVTGVVTGISAKNLYFQDADGGYLVFNNGGLNLDASVTVGKTITLTGTKDIYKSNSAPASVVGLHQISSITKIVVGDDATVAPVDITDLCLAAEAATDAELYATQAMLVTVKGVRLEVSGSSFYLNIGKLRVQLYFAGSNQVLDTNSINAIKELFTQQAGRLADITGYVALYNDGFQLLPAANGLVIDQNSKFPLEKPTLSLDQSTGTVSWNADPNASGYEYQIKEAGATDWGSDDDVFSATKIDNAYSVKLENGQTIRVRALGGGDYEAKSEWSAEKTYNADTVLPTETEFKFNAKYSADTELDGESLTQDGVTVAFAQTDKETVPKYYTNGTAVRVYAGNTVTVSADQKIKKIEFTAGQDILKVSVSTGAYAISGTTAATWHGYANSIVFTVSANSRIGTMKLYLGDASDAEKVEIALALLPDYAGEHNEDFDVVTTAEFDLSVTWSAKTNSGDGSIDFEGTTAKVTRGSSDSSLTVSASITLGGTTEKRDYTVTMLAAGSHIKVLTLLKPDALTSLIQSGDWIGSTVIITSAATDGKALSTAQANNNRSATATAVDTAKFDGTNPGDICMLEIVEGSTNNTYAFKTLNAGTGANNTEAGKYLYAPGGGNYLRTQATNNDKSSFTISLAADGAATIVFQGSGVSQSYMRYNGSNSSNLFGCYAQSSATGTLPYIWVYA